MDRNDLDFLRRVDELGRQGLTGEQIAREVGYVTASGVQARVYRLGFRMSGLTEIRETRTGRPLADLLAAGEIVADDAPAAEAAGVTA